MSSTRSTDSVVVEHPHQVVQHVADRDRLALRVDPARRDHDRQHLGEVAQHLERQRARPDDHRRAEFGGRRRARRQDLADLVPALEVGGQLGPGAHPAQVHDAFDAGGVRGVAEVRRGAGVGVGEVVAATHRVHEVVRRGAAVERGGQRVGVEDVARAHLDVVGPVVPLRSAGRSRHDPHRMPAREQLGHESAADVTRRSRDEDPASVALIVDHRRDRTARVDAGASPAPLLDLGSGISLRRRRPSGARCSAPSRP